VNIMKNLFLWLIVILGIATLLTLASAKADDARTNRLYARAHLVEANSSARQDLLVGMMPYAVLGLATVGGVVAIVALAAGAVAVVAVWSDRGQARPMMIERQMIIMIQPGQSRREVYKLLSNSKELQ
jgi:ABC-type multidrug transport system permease subunit